MIPVCVSENRGREGEEEDKMEKTQRKREKKEKMVIWSQEERKERGKNEREGAREISQRT